MTEFVWLVEVVGRNGLTRPMTRYLHNAQGVVTENPHDALKFDKTCAELVEVLCNTAFPLLSDQWKAREHGFVTREPESVYMEP